MTRDDEKHQEAPNRLRRVAKLPFRSDHPSTSSSSIPAPPRAALVPEKLHIDDNPAAVDGHPGSPREAAKNSGRVDEAERVVHETPKTNSRHWAGKVGLFGSPKSSSKNMEKDIRGKRKSAETRAHAMEAQYSHLQTSQAHSSHLSAHSDQDDNPNTTIPLQPSSDTSENGDIEPHHPQDNPEAPSSPSTASSTGFVELMEEKNYWKSRFTAVNQEYLRTQKDANTAISSLKADADYKTSRLVAELDRAHRSEHESARLLTAQKKEIKDLQSHILDLKRSISVSTRMDSQVADDILRDQIRTLGHELQNWTISSFRRAKLNSAVNINVHPSDLTASLSSILPHSSLQALQATIPTYQSLLSNPAHKLPFIQAYSARVITDLVFGHYFPGLPASLVTHFSEAEIYLSQTVTNAGADSSTASKLNTWRAGGLSMIRGGLTDSGNSSSVSASTSELTHSVIAEISSILARLFTFPPSPSSMSSSSSVATVVGPSSTTTSNSDPYSTPALSDLATRHLTSIIDQAIRLAQLLRVQRAVFKVEMPGAGTAFDGRTMEDVNFENGDEDDGQGGNDDGRSVVLCGVFPAVVKRGDEGGDNMHLLNTIVKAKVLVVTR